MAVAETRHLMDARQDAPCRLRSHVGPQSGLESGLGRRCLQGHGCLEIVLLDAEEGKVRVRCIPGTTVLIGRRWALSKAVGPGWPC